MSGFRLKPIDTFPGRNNQGYQFLMQTIIMNLVKRLTKFFNFNKNCDDSKYISDKLTEILDKERIRRFENFDLRQQTIAKLTIMDNMIFTINGIDYRYGDYKTLTRIGCLTKDETHIRNMHLSNNYGQENDDGILMPHSLFYMCKDELQNRSYGDAMFQNYLKAGKYYHALAMRAESIPIDFEFYDHDLGFVNVFLECIFDFQISESDCVKSAVEMIDDIYFEMIDDDHRLTERKIRMNPNLFPKFFDTVRENDGSYDDRYAFKKKLLLLSGDVEENPGPASVEFHNFATRQIEYLTVVISESAAVDDTGAIMWTVKIELPLKTQCNSGYHSDANKKVCYEACYREIMLKIRNDIDEYGDHIARLAKKEMNLDVQIAQLLERKARIADARHESENITEGSHGEETSATLTALHTNLDVTTEESAGVPTVAAVLNEMKTTTENIGNYDNLTGQYYLLDHFEWDVVGTGFPKEYVLPKLLLTANIAANSPILIPFNVNYMWRGVIEVRLQTKAQMFLTGQLQVSSFYELDADADAALRRNVFTASQSNHTLVNAGGSNDAVLYIPYVNRQPFIQTKLDTLGTNSTSVLNAVNVLIQILNPLKVGTGSSNVDVAVFVRFIESKFHGKRDGAIGAFPTSTLNANVSDARHESFFDALSLVGTGVRVAESVLREVKRDKNRDNPPEISPSTMLVPYAAQSWAAGTDTAEPLRTLRLSPLGQTLHDDSLENIMTLPQISQIFGLLRTIEWSESQPSGTTLLILPCEPLMDPSFYQLNTIYPTRENRYVPPIGVVASLFNLYRGPLKFRMDMIANKFYTGGLIMGYIPGISPLDTVSNELLRNSAFTTYSLDANNLSITYETPFVNAAEWYTTKFRKPYARAEYRLPGCFVVNVLQRLQQPETVNSTIDVNVYMAAGSGFECSVLTQPSLVVPADATYVANPSLRLTPLNDHLNNWHNTNADGWVSIGACQGWANGVSTTPLRYSAVPTNLSFIGRSNVTMTIVGTDYNDFLFLRYHDGLRIFLVNQAAVQLTALTTALNSVPYEDTNAARAAVQAAAPGAFSPLYPINTFWPSTSFIFTIIWAQGDPPMILDARHESEREQEPNLVTSVQHYATNGWGMGSFGEDFGSVKDLLRRPIHNEDFTYQDSEQNKFPNALFKIKVTPVPPPPDLTDQFDLINRSSHTKILLSGYRYYRGGMRYRIIMPYLPGVYAWVQYDPSDKIPQTSINYPEIGLRTPIVTHSNPQDLLTLQVNQILNVEIPWYNANQLNLLQEIDYNALDSDQRVGADMGSFMVGLSTNTSETIPGSYAVKVFSKVADDFSPYVFQGFPPMTSLLFLNPTDVGMMRDNRKKIVVEDARHESDESVIVEDARHEMMKGFVKSSVTANIIDPIVEEVKEQIDIVAVDVKTQIGDITSSIATALSEIMNKIKKSATVNMDFNLNIVLTDVVSQLGHCLMNPSIKTLVWAIISMLTKIGVLSMNVIAKAINLFTNICTSIFEAGAKILPTHQRELGAEDVRHEADEEEDDSDVAAFWGLIISSCASLIGLSTYKGAGGKEIAGKIGKDLRGFSMTANGLTGFFKLHLRIIKKILGHLCFWRLVTEKEPGSMFVYNETFVRTWCNEVSYLAAPGMLTKISCDTYLIDRVYLAYMIGELIAKTILTGTKHKLNNAVLTKQLTAIRKLHEKCTSLGKAGNVRRETFGVWIDGAPGIGKSTIVEDLSTMLVLKMGIEFEGDIKLPLNPTDEFWSRCDKQPILWMDDAFQVQTERLIEKQLAAYFSVMAPTPLCPPMADLDSKDKLYEPYGMITTANSSFPNVKQVASQEALWRRRHVLMQMKINQTYLAEHIPNYDGKIRLAEEIPKELTNYETYPHLCFRFAYNPSNQYTKWTEWRNWNEAKEYISAKYEIFEERALLSYTHRLNKYYEAKRKILPNYLNMLPNVPGGSNLFDVARELAMKLDQAAQDTDRTHWYSLMTETRQSAFAPLWNMPKHLAAMMVGIYPRLTYGVNSILNGKMPSKKGFDAYTAHGLGWNSESHQHGCPAYALQFDRPFAAGVNVTCVNGARARDMNPFSIQNRRIVQQSHDLSQFCNPFREQQIVEEEHQFDAMLEEDVEEEVVRFNLMDLFGDDDVDARHEMSADDELDPKEADNPKQAIAMIRRTLSRMTLVREKLLSLMMFICKFKKYVDEATYLRLLNFYNVSLRTESDHMGVANIRYVSVIKMVYDYIFYEVVRHMDEKERCVHFSLVDYIYYAKTNKFKRSLGSTSFNDMTEFVIRGKPCNSETCALKNVALLNMLFHFVQCPDGFPSYYENYVEASVSQMEEVNIDSFKESCLDKLREWSVILYGVFRDWWKVIVAGVGLCIGTWFLFFKKGEPCTRSEGAAYDKNKAKTQVRKTIAKRKIVKLTSKEKIIAPAGHESNQNLSDVIKKITRNIIFLKVRYTNDGLLQEKIYRVVMLGGRRCLMIRHYVEEILYFAEIDPETKLFMLTNGTSEVNIGVDVVRTFSVLEDQIEDDFDETRSGTGERIYNGLCVVDMPMIVPQFSSVIKHFVNERDEKRMSSSGVLVRPTVGDKASKGIPMINTHTVTFKNYDNLIVHGTHATSDVVLSRSWKYDNVFGYGYCGSLLLNADSCKIIGIHTAGSPKAGSGFSERLVREEWIDEEESIPEIFQPVLEDITLDDRQLEGSVFPLGKVPKQYAKQESGKSKIVESVLHGEFEVTTFPAPLTGFDPRLPPGCSPLYDGVAAHGDPPIEFPPELVKKAGDDYADLMIAKCKPVRPVSIWSEKEAIFGNSILGIAAMPLDTSEGFPLSSMRPHGTKGKGWLINDIKRDKTGEVVSYNLHVKLRQLLDVHAEMRKRGIKPFTVFVDCLKDETLPLRKCVKKGGTRIFSMSPVQFTIQSRQYLGDWILAHNKHRDKAEHAIGINVNSSEWTELLREANHKGKHHVAGDHGKFGPRCQSAVARALFDGIKRWYAENGASEHHLKVIDIMAEELINSVHLCFDILYQVFCGIVSGSLFTANFNSGCNSIYHRIGWLELTGYPTFKEWYEKVYLVTYGDDGNAGVSPDISDKFNVKTLHEFFKKYNMEYTDVHKNVPSSIEPYCAIEDSTFLKCAWKPHPRKHGFYLAALDKNSVEGQLNWVSVDGDRMENTKVNCVSALRQAFGHGEEYYNSLYSKIKSALAKHGEHFIYKSWGDLYLELEGDFYSCSRAK